jgi:hypothetical protein
MTEKKYAHTPTKEGDYVDILTNQKLVLYVTDVNSDGTYSGAVVGHYTFKPYEVQRDPSKTWDD